MPHRPSKVGKSEPQPWGQWADEQEDEKSTVFVL